MVSRFRPLDVKFVFEDRPYKLGETIEIEVELNARCDVEVREGRIDLMCEEHYKQTFSVAVTRSTGGGLRGGGPPITIKENRQVTHTRDESYPHSSAIFLSEARLRSGETNRHKVRLMIGPEPPQHMSDATVTEAKVSWALEAVFDVAQARDVTDSQQVQVTLT